MLISESVGRVEQGTVLVDKAGTTTAEVALSIQKVTAIVADISSASAEQSQGVTQVAEAVAQMDTVTQQNAALVEESAAAADCLRRQAAELLRSVEVFRLSDAAAQPITAPVAAPAPARPAAAQRFMPVSLGARGVTLGRKKVAVRDPARQEAGEVA